MANAVSRRSVLRSGAFIAAANAIPASLLAKSTSLSGTPGDAGPPVQLGLAGYTFRDFDRARMIGFMQQLHVSALNAKDVRDQLPMDPAGEAAALQAYASAGISLHAVGAVSFTKDDAASLRNNFEYARRARVPVIVASDPAPAALPRIEELVREFNIRIAIHNHGPEDKLWPSPLDVLKAVKDMDPRMGCCIDVGHCVRAGTNVVDAIHQVGPRLFNIHMKDLTDFRDKNSQVAVGEGKMPVPQIFQALIQTRYKGFVDLEYEVHADDPMPGVISSFAYMRGVLAGMSNPL